MNKNFIRSFKNIILSVVIFIITLFWAVPIIIAVLNGFKDITDISSNPNGLPQTWHFENFITAFNKGKYLIGLSNSSVLTLISIVFIIIVCSSISYPLSRISNKFNQYIYNYLIAGLMIPIGLTMLPTFRLLKNLNILNTRFALVALYIAVNTPFIVILYTSFLKTIPKELDESAQLDGCSLLYTYWKIIFPLMKPATTTSIILVGTQLFNEFIYNLLFASKVRTVALALYDFKGQYFTQWNYLFAAVIISMIIPVLVFLFFQKYFEKGLVSGAVKG